MPTDEPSLPRWQRALPGGSTIATSFTTLCCIGVSAATSLLTSLGVGVLINDKYLSIGLVIAITITSVASSFTYQRHHDPIPLLLTLASGFWIYYFTFSDYQKTRVWLGLAVLIGTQLYDAYRTTRACRIPPAPPGDATTPATPGTRQGR